MGSNAQSIETQAILALQRHLLDQTDDDGDVISALVRPRNESCTAQDISNCCKMPDCRGLNHGSTNQYAQSSPVSPALNYELDDVTNNGARSITHGNHTSDIVDTQPVHTQVFKAYSEAFTSRLSQQQVGSARVRKDDHDSGLTASAGQDGVHLMNGPKEELEEEDLVSSYSDIEVANEVRPIVARHASRFPETPGLAGRKRSAAGEVRDSVPLTSVTRTPGSALAAIFGGRKEVGPFSLTQIFEGTQAPSSPLPGDLRSDPIFQRPSPGNVLRQSSPPLLIASSPVKPVQRTITRTASDPIACYRSIKESQERREKTRLQLQMDSQKTSGSELLDGSLPSEVHRILLREEKERRLQDALLSCNDLTAPVKPWAKPPKRATSDPKGAIDLTTPAPKLREPANNLPSDVSDALDGLSEYEPRRGSARENADGIQVPMTSSRQDDESRPVETQTSPSIRSHTLQYGTGGKQNIEHMDPERIVSQIGGTSTQKTIAIFDSQSNLVETESSGSTRDVPTSPAPSDTGCQSSDESLVPQEQATLSSTAPTQSSVPSASQTVDSSLLSSIAASRLGSTEADSTALRAFDDDADGFLEPEARQITESGQDNLEPLLNNFDQGASPEDVNPHNKLSSRPDMQFTTDSTKTSKELSTQNFATAETHRSPTNTASVNQLRLPQPDIVHVSTQNGAVEGADPLANVGSQVVHSQASVNLDEIEFFTEKDNDFQQLIGEARGNEEWAALSGSSPVRPAKRRKPNGTTPLYEPARNANALRLSVLANANIVKGDAKHQAPLSEDSQRDELAYTPVDTFKYNQRIKNSAVAATPMVPGANFERRSVPLQNPTITNSSLGKRGKLVGLSRPSSERTTRKSAGVENLHQRQGPISLPLDPDKLGQQRAHFSDPSAPEPAVSPASNVIRHPERVLAIFRGTVSGYFPATCLGSSLEDPRRLSVRFDDGTMTKLECFYVCRLELKVGDQVKVDLDGFRTKTYVVEGLSDPITGKSDHENVQGDYANGNILVDMYGNRKAMLSIKPLEGRNNPNRPLSSQLISVDIANLYVTQSIWSKFADRRYAELSPSDPIGYRRHTPTIIPSASSTPSHRARRQTAVEVVPDPSHEISRDPNRQHGIFAHMAFAITLSTDLDTEKVNCVKLLRDNGAVYLNNGFDELFEPAESRQDVPEAREETLAGDCTLSSLRLTSTAQALGFVALLADKHSRRPKHIQALALNLPCLHYRWLIDCIAQATLLPFNRYLLPAGESSFLQGAVKSSSIIPFDPASASAKLKTRALQRANLLQGRSVLLVTGKGKTGSSRKTFEFLSYAMGAGHVRRVVNINEAKQVLSEQKWDWVHVDGDESIAQEVLNDRINDNEAFANSGKQQGRGKKRKRSEINQSKLSGTPLQGAIAREGGVKVVGDEYIIQSLISGELL